MLVLIVLSFALSWSMRWPGLNLLPGVNPIAGNGGVWTLDRRRCRATDIRRKGGAQADTRPVNCLAGRLEVVCVCAALPDGAVACDHARLGGCRDKLAGLLAPVVR